MTKRAYIDIETTGLSRDKCELTVVGIAIETGNTHEVIQLVGDQISDLSIIKALDGVKQIYSYNGLRFDLPFIRTKTKIDLTKEFKHTDLMYVCLKNGYKGGLKKVEAQLGINRKLKDVDGREAIFLWWDYINNNDQQALEKLLIYNSEDVINLISLRRKLNVD